MIVDVKVTLVRSSHMTCMEVTGSSVHVSYSLASSGIRFEWQVCIEWQTMRCHMCL